MVASPVVAWMKGRRETLGVLAVGLLIGALLAWGQFGDAATETLPRYGRAPALALIDSKGKPFPAESLRGKVWLLNFFFTSCPSECPAMQGNLAWLFDLYRKTEGVRFLSVTIDPETDTLPVLVDSMARYRAEAGRWDFLTGTSDEISRLRSESLKLDDGHQKEFHTSRVVLVDREGEVRGFYRGMEMDDMKRLHVDIQRLLG